MADVATRAQLLAFRRRITEAASKRRRPPRVPPALLPKGPELAYTKALRELSTAMDDAILAELTAMELVPRADADGDVPRLKELAPAAAKRARAAVNRVLKGKSFLQRLEDLAGRVVTHSRGQWESQLKAAMGVNLVAAEPNLEPTIERFRDENVKLIKSLADEKVTRVRDILTDAGPGTRVEEIAKSLREMGDVTRSRAELIARDQVLKLNAEVTEVRHKAAGIEEFVWSTSRDERVRPDHKALEGQRYRYDDPPIVDRRRGTRGLPGAGSVQCRCVAVPIIPGFDD